MSDGVVTKTRDDLPDQVPLIKPPALTFGQLPGNHIVIEESGTRLRHVYAHMKPGSVRVRDGDRVEAGDVIGRLGNSGGSLAPHLHFHIVNGPSVGRSDGYPYAIDSFKLAAGSNLDGLAAALQGEPGFPTRAEMSPRRHRRELPLGFTIVDFPR
jgi:murein DD-endopeptidase MepM/ murein hydrolase activator NlpD